jgi:hypothetical protein
VHPLGFESMIQKGTKNEKDMGLKLLERSKAIFQNKI